MDVRSSAGGRKTVKGFFDKAELQDSDAAVRGRRLSCFSCGLYKGPLSPKMPPYGKGKKKIMVVGEGPGFEEDKKGKQWQGKTGRMLQKSFVRFDFSLFDDSTTLNAVNCRPPENRDPTRHELACCRHVIVNPAWFDRRPHVIMLFGKASIESVIGQSWSKDLGKVGRWRGWVIPDRRFKAWLCPMNHPSYILREDREEVWSVWYEDLERAFSALNEPLPKYLGEEDEKSSIVILESDADIEVVLNRIRKGEEGKWVYFDYETTGLKPQGGGHRIVCVSVATRKATYAFLHPRSKRAVRSWCRLLSSVRIGKAAHNIAFEDTWSEVVLGTRVRNWIWDSMQAAHILDNRSLISGLKFQVYAHYGLVGYDDAVGSYMRSHNGGNNRLDLFIQEGHGDELLQYCGLDSSYGRRLARKQMKELEYKFG